MISLVLLSLLGVSPLIWVSSKSTLPPLHLLFENHIPSSKGQWWLLGGLAGVKGGDAAVGICKCKVIRSVAAILGRQRLCLPEQRGDIKLKLLEIWGRQMGWGGRTSREARDFHSEDTGMVCWGGAVLVAHC